MSRRISPRLATALFFTLLTLTGLLTAADYGLPCDEPSEQVILQSNLYEYALRLLGADSAPAVYYASQDVIPISQSEERDHGEAAYYLAAPILQLTDTAPDRMTVLWHAYTWLWFMAGVFSLYRLMRLLGLNRVLGCLTVLLLHLSPRFFAEGHYNNKDVVLLALTLWTLASGARFLQSPTLPHALPFALAGALATNTKIVGAFAWGLIALATLIRLLHRRELTPKRIRAGLFALVAYLAFYVLLTPALWGDPAGYFRYVLQNASAFSRWTGVVYYGGVYYNPTRGLPLPRLYLPGMIALTTPIFILLLSAIGQVRALVLWHKKDDRRAMLFVLTALWTVPLVYAVLARPILYNGWRHFYFLYAALAALAGLGLQSLWTLMRNRRTLTAVGASALSVLLAYQAVGIAVNHPYQYAYYNALAGDAQAGYELDYWDVSTVNAMRMLCTTQARDESLPLTLGSRDTMSAYGIEHGYAVLSTKERTALTLSTDVDAPYLFYNTTYAGIYGVAAPEGYRVLFSIESYGNTLCTVYERILTEP